MLKNFKFLYTGANSNQISNVNNNMNNYSNVNFHCLSNETNPSFVGITLLNL